MSTFVSGYPPREQAERDICLHPNNYQHGLQRVNMSSVQVPVRDSSTALRMAATATAPGSGRVTRSAAM
ncbi:hypothetical protein EYF80_062228 [Liparis tanakae]|uniref:Uncharacterized protein n=1 Tax=Liparis tanakae TaxID=230148 RepID=A0A4Z2EFX3_9TELE|nr:hypothetical protein EYF80_062228 [Liparis tanakae]